MPLTIHSYCLLHLKTNYILLDSAIVGFVLIVLKFVKLFVMFCFNIIILVTINIMHSYLICNYYLILY